MRRTHYVMIFLVILFLMLGQFLGKLGSRSITLDAFSLGQLMDPLILTAVFFLIVRGFLWAYVLKISSVSFAYPFISLSFVLILPLAYFAFDETVTVWKILGSLLIIIGILVNARSVTAPPNPHT